MCKAIEHPRLKDIQHPLLDKYPDAEVIESDYEEMMDGYAIKTKVKVPPATDKFFKRSTLKVLCILGIKRADFIVLPDNHLVKKSGATGQDVVQNFYVPADYEGRWVDLFVNVKKRIDYTGKISYVLDYFQVPKEFKHFKSVYYKIGTPKKYPREVRRIKMGDGKAIPFFLPN